MNIEMNFNERIQIKTEDARIIVTLSGDNIAIQTFSTNGKSEYVLKPRGDGKLVERK
jgi:hypothetical protein